ncbi:ABC transporter ATP-binding protein [Patescibacteria group bacterium]|nr:ABC transporter ATP-binding protein [Patescibacteria group bacterium]
MAKTIIDCRKISKTYVNGDVKTTVLKGVSFTIAEGEFVAVIGPSGSGKSTLMHILGALDTPTDGEYRLDGVNVANLNDNQLAEIRSQKIGFVFQSFNLLARATVLRNVELPLVYTKVPADQRENLAKRALKSAGLDEDRYRNRSNQLSGGQQQRVAIARALINNPSIILADEPTGNLDQKTGRVVLNTFQQLNDAGRTIVLITHDQYVAEHANRIIHIRDGNILEDQPNKPLQARMEEDL